MITNAFISIFYFVLVGLIALLPSVSSLPANVDSALNFFIPYWSAWNNVFPLASILSVISLILTVEFSILIFKSINFILKKIRGSG